MGLITYDVSINPAAPQVNITIGATASSITVTLNSMGDFSVSANPSAGTIVAGAIAGAIVGTFLGPAGTLLGGGGGVGAVYAVGALVASKMHDAIKDGIAGKQKTIDFGKPIGYSFDVQGVTVNVQAATLSLSTYNGMLMATGSVNVG